jgi:nucleotide-binding universal stress UspA family protein
MDISEAIDPVPAVAAPAVACRVIAVGVDGSSASAAAVQWAAGQARDGARLRLIHVRELPAAVSLTVGRRRYRPVVERYDGSRLQELVGELRGRGVEATGEICDGEPSEVLIGASWTADLLVLGAEGHGRHRGLLLGEVAQRCVRSAGCPLVVVPPPERLAG